MLFTVFPPVIHKWALYFTCGNSTYAARALFAYEHTCWPFWTRAHWRRLLEDTCGRGEWDRDIGQKYCSDRDGAGEHAFRYGQLASPVRSIASNGRE